MTILSVIKSVCSVIGIDIPSEVYTSTEPAMVEMQAMANEMAQRIAFDGRDWTKLKALATLTGDGSALGFNLPADYQRMLKKARLWPSASPYAPFAHYADTDQWLGITTQNFQNLIGAWTIIGEQLMIRPAMANLATAQFYYITRNIVKAVDNSVKAEFTVDTDVFRLDERILKLGIIWQWKASKGQSYGEEMSTYEDALAVQSGGDKGSNIIVVGRGRRPVDADIAFPGVITP